MAKTETPWGRAELVEELIVNGPVTLRERDLARLRAGLGQYPALAEALGLRPG